ncbi:Mif2/CENP-C like [Rhizoctonia solani]|uniref:Mif2/CENP-C like n=1 Tax=Rhizoctonia solani TaxID=456999 RepID=A0A8H7I2Y8_9AGAM|nr:Mif2/CENP-C like [Rhizoctonia solani]
MNDRRRSRAELRKGAPAFVDDANTGRRTGKFIPTVQLDEDGFESIEGLFGSQAYAVDAPKQRARKKLATVVEYSYIEEEEEEGESMELTRIAENEDDMDDYDIPEVQPAPAPVRRPVVHRSSPIIDDHVPSPQRFSQSSQSTRRARAPLNSPDGVTLEEPTLSVVQEQDEEIDVDVGSPPPPPPSPPKVVKKEKLIAPAEKPSSSSGNNPRSHTDPPPPANDDMEEEIANGLAQLDAGGHEEDEPEPEPPAKSGAKAKGRPKGKDKAKEKRPRDEEEDGQKSPKKPRAGKGKENANARKPLLSRGSEEKARFQWYVLFTRTHLPTCDAPNVKDFLPWSGGAAKSSSTDALQIQKKAHYSFPSSAPLNDLPNRRSHTLQKGTQERRKEDKDAKDGLDEETEELGVVMDYATGREVERRIAFPGARVDFSPSEGPFSFQKIFGDSDYFAAGVMKIPVGGRKPNRPSKREHHSLFTVYLELSKVKVHKSTFTIAPGGMFLAPRGNVYTIANISQRDAYIFFAQSRKVLDDSEEPPPLPREKESLPTKAKAKVVAKK